jgi:hypothetical protein
MYKENSDWFVTPVGVTMWTARILPALLALPYSGD